MTGFLKFKKFLPNPMTIFLKSKEWVFKSINKIVQIQLDGFENPNY